MILLTTLSAVAGGLCGLIEGPQWWREIETHDNGNDWRPAERADTRSAQRHLKAVRKQQKQWKRKRYLADSPRTRLTCRWILQEWNSGKLVPNTAMECPVLFSYYLTEQEDGSITVCAPWDQFNSNAKSIA